MKQASLTAQKIMSKKGRLYKSNLPHRICLTSQIYMSAQWSLDYILTDMVKIWYCMVIAWSLYGHDMAVHSTHHMALVHAHAQ